MTRRVLLDTSGYSAAMQGHEEIAGRLREADDIYVTPIVLGELIAGFLKGSSARKNRGELRTFLSSPRVGVLSVDEETSERYGVIRESLRKAGTPVPTNDLWIAASAMQHGLTVLTTDRHYGRIPQITVLLCEAE